MWIGLSMLWRSCWVSRPRLRRLGIDCVGKWQYAFPSELPYHSRVACGTSMRKTSDNLQGTLALLILKTLARGANHGFGIAQHIQEASEGLLRVEEGSLYPALHRLERNKLVTATWQITGNGRRA